MTTKAHPELADMVNDVKRTHGTGPNGPFYINEYKQVIVPVGDEAQYYFAGTYDAPLQFEFEGKTISGEPLDLDGKPLRPGDTWTGPHAGIPYVLAAAGNDVYYRTFPRPNVEKRVKLSAEKGRSAAEQIARLLSAFKGAVADAFTSTSSVQCSARSTEQMACNTFTSVRLILIPGFLTRWFRRSRRLRKIRIVRGGLTPTSPSTETALWGHSLRFLGCRLWSSSPALHNAIDPRVVDSETIRVLTMTSWPLHVQVALDRCEVDTRVVFFDKSGLTLLRTAPAHSSGTFPVLRVNPEDRGNASCQVDETAVIADFAVAKQPGQQG